MSKPTERRQVQTTKTSFKIIHLLQDKGPSHLSEIAEQLDMAESTAHRHLSTLQELRYVSRSDKLYQLGLRFTRLGMSAQTRDPAFSQMETYVQKLAEETEERAQFVSEDHGIGVYLYQFAGSQAVDVGTNRGRQIHLHSASSGKSILSQYSSKQISEIIDRWGLPANTEHTITNRDELDIELETVRDQGYAVNRQEAVEGVHAVGVPIKPNGRVIGALSVAGPSHRFQGEWFEEKLPNLLLSTANEAEINIAHDEAEHSGTHIIE